MCGLGYDRWCVFLYSSCPPFLCHFNAAWFTLDDATSADTRDLKSCGGCQGRLHVVARDYVLLYNLVQQIP